ncbi:hypothetical protein L7F22_058556 [Adiantum nelumboides]|nr:hypothetical protein [Adiantum nelumboides]
MDIHANSGQPATVGVSLPLAGSSSGVPFENPRPPLAASTLGIRLSLDSQRAIHDLVSCIEPCSLVCKVVGAIFSSRQVQDWIQGALLSLVEIVNVSPLGRGYFRIQFKTPSQADEVLARSPVDLCMAIGFFSRWKQGMNLSSLDGGLIVTARFPGLLPEFVPYLKEIGRCIGFVAGDVMVQEGEDRTPRLRMVLPPSLAKDPPLFISLPSIHGGEILQRVFFIGLPGHCFVCGRKGHLAAVCTRRRVPSDERQQATDLEQKRQSVSEGHQDPVKEALDIGERRQRSDAERARRRVAKKRRRKHARISEGLRVDLVYRRRIPPPSLDLPSTSAPAFEPSPISEPMVQQSSSCFSDGESSYEKLFPSLVESCKKSPVKEPRRSARKKGKA